FERDTAAEAAKKAFLTNRIGDFGFMLGILMAWTATGTVVFSEMSQQLGRITSYPGYLTVSVLLIFCGAVGKSAQFPLHVWLPDRKSTRLNSSHVKISYAVFCLKKKNKH